MILWSLFFCLSILSGSFAYSSKSTHHNEEQQLSVWARLSIIGSKSLLTGLESDDYQVIEDALTQPNITFFLPRDSAIQSAISSNTLNFTRINETIPQILRHILPAPYPANSLLSGRQYILTNDSTRLPLAIGPSQQNNNNNNNNENDPILQIYSGVVTANVIVKDIHCSNGIIHLIDQFLTPPMETLPTIETIPELETHEQLMKSLNLTSVVSGPNKTVLAPNDAAWDAANASTMPYGTLVHNLKYQVIEGIYLSTSLFTSSPDMTITLNTQRRESALRFQRAPDDPNQLLVVGKSMNDVARIIRSDIITSQGVVHIVDKVLSADEVGVTNGLGDGTADTTRAGGGGQLAGAPAYNPSDAAPAHASRGTRTILCLINPTLLISFLMIVFL